MSDELEVESGVVFSLASDVAHAIWLRRDVTAPETWREWIAEVRIVVGLLDEAQRLAGCECHVSAVRAPMLDAAWRLYRLRSQLSDAGANYGTC